LQFAIQKHTSQERSEEPFDNWLREAFVSQRLDRRRFGSLEQLLQRKATYTATKPRHAKLVTKSGDRRECGGEEMPRAAPRIRKTMKLPPVTDQRARLEASQREPFVIEHPSGLRVRSQQHLETAIEKETVHFVRSRAAPHVIGGFQDASRNSSLVQAKSAAESCETSTNDHDARI
jgi:hypothetical protein